MAATARVPLSRLLRSLRSLAPVLVVLGAFQWWAVGPAYAARIVLGITTAFVAAGLLTATTPVTTMLDAVVRGARPVSRWVDPEVVALTLAVVLRSVPWVAGRLRRRARLGPSPGARAQSARAGRADRHPGRRLRPRDR